MLLAVPHWDGSISIGPCAVSRLLTYLKLLVYSKFLLYKTCISLSPTNFFQLIDFPLLLNVQAKLLLVTSATTFEISISQLAGKEMFSPLFVCYGYRFFHILTDIVQGPFGKLPVRFLPLQPIVGPMW